MATPLIAPPANAAEQMENGIWVDVCGYSRGNIGKLVIVFFANEVEGRMAICGTYFMDGGTARFRRFRQALRGYRFFYNGNVIATNADFLAETENESQLGQVIACQQTDIPFTADANSRLNGRLPFTR